MKTITITFSVNDRELELLRLGKCDKPNPQRIKMMLLQEAAKNLRWMSETVINEARELPKPARGHDAHAERLLLAKEKRRERDQRALRKVQPLLTSRTAEKRLRHETPEHVRTRAAAERDRELQLPARRPLDDGKVN